MRNPLLKQCTKMTILSSNVVLFYIVLMYRAFYKSNTNEQLHKIIDI
jgi:hypothetical protein